MKLAYKISNALTNLAILAVILCAVTALSGLFIPKLFGAKPYIVLSSSMEPVIHIGSLVYIKETDEPLNVGDIIGYSTGDTPVVHRIIGKGDEGYITQGDANDIPDMNEVTESQVLGKCGLVIPKMGYFLSSVRSRVIPVGNFQVPVLIPAAAILLFVLYAAQYCIGLLAFSNPEDHAEEQIKVKISRKNQ